jgi:hypothetical protein
MDARRREWPYRHAAAFGQRRPFRPKSSSTRFSDTSRKSGAPKGVAEQDPVNITPHQICFQPQSTKSP